MISIVGRNIYSKTLSSVQGAPTGSSGNWAVVLNLNNVANIAVNDYLTIRNATGGTKPYHLDGCHLVSARPFWKTDLV